MCVGSFLNVGGPRWLARRSTYALARLAASNITIFAIFLTYLCIIEDIEDSVAYHG